MTKLKLLLKSVRFSVDMIYKSSNLWIIVYLLLSMVASTLGLASTYALKYLIDTLTVENTVLQSVIIWIAIYIAILLLSQGAKSVQNILYNTIFQKAAHLYDCRLSEKLSALPLSVIDSSEGKDMVDDVRYAKNTAVYLTYRLVVLFSLAYTFGVAFATLVFFNIWFSLLLFPGELCPL